MRLLNGRLGGLFPGPLPRRFPFWFANNQNPYSFSIAYVKFPISHTPFLRGGFHPGSTPGSTLGPIPLTPIPPPCGTHPSHSSRVFRPWPRNVWLTRTTCYAKNSPNRVTPGRRSRCSHYTAHSQNCTYRFFGLRPQNDKKEPWTVQKAPDTTPCPAQNQPQRWQLTCSLTAIYNKILVEKSNENYAITCRVSAT